MKCLVRKDPAKAVGKAAGEYFKDIVFYRRLVAELETDSALEKQLLAEIIGAINSRSRIGYV